MILKKEKSYFQKEIELNLNNKSRNKLQKLAINGYLHTKNREKTIRALSSVYDVEKFYTKHNIY